VTIPTQHFERTTIYSPTIVETVTSTVTRGAEVTVVPKMKKRGRCGTRTSSLTSSSEPAEPATTSISAPLFPTAYNCLSLEEYSSACACITAVDTTISVTADAPVATSTVPATVSVAVPSTSMSTVTQVDTTTTFVYSTLTVAGNHVTVPTTTTTTVTSTSLILAPTQTAHLVIGPSNFKGMPLGIETWGYLSYMPNVTPADIVFTVDGGQPYLASDPSRKLWGWWPTALHAGIPFITDAEAKASHADRVICSVGQDGQIACRTEPNNLTVIVGCNAMISMNSATWENPECPNVLPLYLANLRLKDGSSVQVQLPN
jgi:hypothetical protein